MRRSRFSFSRSNTMGKEDLDRVKEMKLGERRAVTNDGDIRPVLLRSNTMIHSDQASRSASKVVCRYPTINNFLALSVFLAVHVKM